MITRIEIDGFKTFREFSLDLGPFMAIVGPNGSGKSNLFDAVTFISGLAQNDIGGAMRALRGTPAELFRRTQARRRMRVMTFAVEVLLRPDGVDAFGTPFRLRTQRLRYEVQLAARVDDDNRFRDAYVRHERCVTVFETE